MKISRPLINKIELEAKKYFTKASGCHDWTHVERVRNLAIQIGKKEKADLGVIELAALLHDIARKAEMKAKGKLCHAEQGAKVSKKILRKYQPEADQSLADKISPEIIEAVVHCIESHRFRNNKVPKTIEAKCLFDADKLDSIGAVGIGRDFLFAGYHKVALYTGKEKYYAQKGIDRAYTKDDSGIMEYEFKLKKIKNKILTRTGKKFALERHKYMVEFFNRFWQEVKGLK